MVQEARNVEIYKKVDKYNTAAMIGAVSVAGPAVTIASLSGDVALTSGAAVGWMGAMHGAGGGTIRFVSLSMVQ